MQGKKQQHQRGQETYARQNIMLRRWLEQAERRLTYWAQYAFAMPSPQPTLLPVPARRNR